MKVARSSCCFIVSDWPFDGGLGFGMDNFFHHPITLSCMRCSRLDWANEMDRSSCNADRNSIFFMVDAGGLSSDEKL